MTSFLFRVEHNDLITHAQFYAGPVGKEMYVGCMTLPPEWWQQFQQLVLIGGSCCDGVEVGVEKSE